MTLQHINISPLDCSTDNDVRENTGSQVSNNIIGQYT